MIKNFKKNKRKHPFIGVLLLLISIILLIITAPFGLIYGLIYKFSKSLFSGVGEFCLKIAVSIDQLGNVLMQHLLNTLFIKNGGYKFGNRDETISSVLGKNVVLDTLSPLGNVLNILLNFIEVNHSLNSIDYYIEPEEEQFKK